MALAQIIDQADCKPSFRYMQSFKGSTSSFFGYKSNTPQTAGCVGAQRTLKDELE